MFRKYVEDGEEKPENVSFPKLPKVPHLSPLPLGVGRARSSVPSWDSHHFPISAVVPRQPLCHFPLQGVVVAGLGTFATVQKHLFGTQKVFVVRRPIFQLAIDKFWLEGLACPTEIIPGEEKAAATLCFPALRPGGVRAPCSLERAGRSRELPPEVGGHLSSPKTNHSPGPVSTSDLSCGILLYESCTEIWPAVAVTLFLLLADDVKVEPLNFQQLSRASGFPWRTVENCVRETILLYSFQLRNGKRFAFAFQDIGILACKGNFLCMQFYSHCIAGLESTASPIALLHSVSPSGFEGCSGFFGSPTGG